MSSQTARISPDLVKQLENKFRDLTTTLYDTSVSIERMEREVAPHLSEDVTFKDPFQSGRGKKTYRAGMAGFHAMFKFHFEFHQVDVQLSAHGGSGRVLIDGVMQLRQLSWLYVYPLRTLLVFDFLLPDPSNAESFIVTAHEEMWSFGDMIEAVPGVGRVYSKWFRPAFARGFLLASRLAVAARGKT